MEDKRIKIAYVISASEIGGTEKMLLLMIENLGTEKFQPPVVFALKGRGKFTEELRKIEIKTYTFNLKKNPFLFIPFVKAVKRESPRILHTFLFYGNLAGRICGRMLKIPVVISSQRSIDAWRKWYHWKIDGFTSRWADLIISNSFAGKDVLAAKSRIPSCKIAVITNGISLDKRESAVDRRSLGVKRTGVVVGTIGNLRKAKGHIYLVKAAEIVLKEFPLTTFVITGEGNLRGYLLREADKRGIADNFVFTGFRADAEEVVQLFDIFVLPSLWEGFPVSLLEAMKYARPAVAFAVADVPFIIEDGKSGFVVPVKSHEQLALKIMALVKDGELRKAMGQRGEKRLKERFSLERMLRDYTAVYEKAGQGTFSQSIQEWS